MSDSAQRVKGFLFHSFLAKGKAGFAGQKFIEAGPDGIVHGQEGVEINGDGFVGMPGEKGFDGGGDEGFFGFDGKFIHRTLAIVGDAEGIEEIFENILLSGEKPELEKVQGDFVAYFLPDGLVHPGVAFGAGFTFDEDGAKFALGGESVDGGFVSWFVADEKRGKNLFVEGRGNAVINLVSFHWGR